jgi:enoyl-CoA hydratase/carnithine racemase
LYLTEEHLSTAETIFDLEGPLAILTFNRPDARNAMTWAMYESLVETCERVDADPDVAVLIIRGAGGKAFGAGTDISQFQSFTQAEDALRYEARISEVLDRLDRVSKPTIAQVEGVAAGAGCAIAVTCDLRVGTPATTMGVPVARTLGNCVSTGTYGRLLDIVGPARAKDMLFTGRLVGADEALAIGLLSRIAPIDTVGSVVTSLAAAIASNAPLTVRVTKEMTRRMMAARRQTEENDRDLLERCYMSDDFKEGVRAFLAKRPPQWKGR